MTMRTSNIVIFVDGMPVSRFALLGEAAQEAADALRAMGEAVSPAMSEATIEPLNFEGCVTPRWAKPRNEEKWRGSGKRRKPRLK